MSEQPEPSPENPVPLLPTQEFADRMAVATGIYRSRLDPIVMACWSFATKPPDPKDLLIITTI